MLEFVVDLFGLRSLCGCIKKYSGTKAIFSGRTYRPIASGPLCLTLPAYRVDLFHIEHTAVCYWTVVRGQGGYTGKELHILYSVITFTELSRFKEMIRKIDPDAFVVVTETLEVMGKRIGNQPHW